MIGIIGAMREEVDELLVLMTSINKREENGYTFYHGMLGKKEVVVVQGGIGKVNATVSATLLCRIFDLEYMINIGTAGGLKQNENVGDVIIGESVVHHDFDITGFGHRFGKIPGMPLFFEADKMLCQYAKEILEENNVTAHVGLIASGDQFVHTKPQVDAINAHFPTALCCEMEAASIAQVCHIFNIPFIITRGLSDIFNKGNNSIQFDTYLKEASHTSALMCYRLAQKL